MYFSLLTTSSGSPRLDQRYAVGKRLFLISTSSIEQHLSLYILNLSICVLVLQVSALLGRIPSAVGYQPTLATDMGTMQERITTTKKGSITSVQVR